jgi:nucleotide-binding universal stress UspA family protein
MAKLYNSEIHFYHLIYTPVDWVKLDLQKEKLYPETVKQIGSARAALRELDKKAERQGLKSRVYLEFDGGQANILKHSGDFNHDFIVTGSSGTRGGIRELLGSNVEKIVRRADVPVIVVKHQEVSFPFKDIVFVSDFLQDVSEAFKHVISIAEKCGAHIHLLRINTKTDFNSIEQGLKPIKEFLKNFPDLDKFSMNVYNEPDVETGINNFLRYKKADLIAMCTHGRTGFLSLFSKSIAEGVTNRSELPVMTIKV